MVSHIPGPIFAPGAVLQNRYRLDEALALGGMAEVWRGHDLVLQRPVAVKLLHPHLATDSSLVERFRREAISAARLSHPHIVPTFDAGTDGDVAYIILGLVHGPTLSEVLEEGPLTPTQAVSVARQISEALHHAHSAGLIHRDIKPSNVLVVGDDFRVMVADFGIAKAVADSTDESLTLPGLVIGTPAYLAPEQASGTDADARSDVYATGVLLHEMLCGHTSADQPTQLNAETSDGSVTPIKCERVPKHLAEIIERATDPDPAQRFQTALDMGERLAQEEKSASDKASGSRSTRMPIQPPVPPRAASPSNARWAAGDDTGETPAVRVRSDATRTVAAKSAPEPLATSRRSGGLRERRRNLWTAAVVLVLIAGAIGIGRYVSQLSGTEGKPAPSAPAPVNLTGAQSFDPLGDKSENDSAVSNLLDGNPATTWSTQSYSNRTLGGLKSGVGVILQTNSNTKLSKLNVTARSEGWAASIYVADSPKTSLGEWGNPVDQQSGLGASATFDLHQTSGSAILIWITDLGTSNKAILADAQLTS